MSNLIEVLIRTSYKVDRCRVAAGVSDKWVEAVLHSEKECEGRMYYLHRAVIRVVNPNNPVLSLREAREGMETGSRRLIDKWHSAKPAGGRIGFYAFEPVRFDLIHSLYEEECNIAVALIKDDV